MVVGASASSSGCSVVAAADASGSVSAGAVAAGAASLTVVVGASATAAVAVGASVAAAVVAGACDAMLVVVGVALLAPTTSGRYQHQRQQQCNCTSDCELGHSGFPVRGDGLDGGRYAKTADAGTAQ